MRCVIKGPHCIPIINLFSVIAKPESRSWMAWGVRDSECSGWIEGQETFKGKARIFLLVDVREFFFRFRFRGRKKKKKKSSENDQLTGHFQSFFFFLHFQSFFLFFFLISPETVKLVVGKPTVCIKSLDRTISFNSVTLKNTQTEPQK